MIKNIIRGLKPKCFRDVGGTAEAMPLRSVVAIEFFHGLKRTRV
jgi:hypothetical protein